MDKYILFDLRPSLYQLGMVYLQEFCGGWSIFIVWNSTAMWQGSILAASAIVQSQQKLVNRDKYILFDPNPS